MIKIISIIVIAVAIFGIALFLFVREALKNRLNYYLLLKNKKNKSKKTDFS